MKETRGDTATGPLAPDALSLPQFGGRPNLRQEIAHILRGAVITGQMRPGVLYSAPTLAEQFGVSATPVREAMLDLANEELVTIVRNKGFRVKELSDRDLDEITSLRTLIEVPTVAEIARAINEPTRAAVEELRPLAREVERLAETGDLIGYVEVDRRFHLSLLALAGNRHLIDVVGNLRARSRLYGLQGLAERGELGRSAAEHEQIVDLVVAGDAPKVAELMRRHIGHVRGSWAGYHEP
ncbi:GntR family transcriptional regulator [Micromonospora halotolerans]|uniref:GntR family transcriptional regulator n=1 Tax=Micromonospora halotolerans TaxID=709879 RepID=A0ABY9ZV24_9ACTN|nr:GntR family transcriptional regulator [Micromonospora halotolerans]WNM39035.1 GntR family transcriptional regulator [Micromonospora halotolerans]